MFFTLLMICFFSYIAMPATETASQSATPTFIMPPPTITVPVNVYFSSHNNASNDVQTAAIANASTELTHKTVINSLQEIQNYAQKIAHEGHMWAYNNPKHVIVGTLLGAYAYTWYKLLALSYAISYSSCWHTYKSHYSFDELLQIPQTTWTQELVKEIQYRYAPQTLGDFFVPFALFLKDIDTEIALLEMLIKMYTWLGRLRTLWLFPWQKFSLLQAEEKLRRIRYIRNSALTWLSTFKFEQYAKNIS